MLDNAVFAGSIHGLENEQEGPLVLGVELFLKIVYECDTLLEKLRRCFLGLDLEGACGVKVFQPERLAVLNAEGPGEFWRLLADVHETYFTVERVEKAKENAKPGEDLPQRSQRAQRKQDTATEES